MKIRRKLALSVAVSTLSIAINASAQQTALPADDQGRQLGRESAAIEEIVVTARKMAESAQSVPISMVALGAEELEAKSIQRIADIQSQVPNLFLQTHPVEPQSLSLAMRGQKQVDLTLTLDPSVGLYVDGFYNPRSIGLRGALVDIERIEALRGPQGTLYGRNTTGGALSIYTKDPVMEPEGSFKVGVGNYSAREISGVVNFPVSDDVAVRLVAQYDDHDGYGEDGLGRDLVEEESGYIRAKIKANLSEKLTAVISASYTDSTNSGAIIQIPQVNPDPFLFANLAVAAEKGLAWTPDNLAMTLAELQSYTNGRGGDIYKNHGTFKEASEIEVFTGGVDLSYEINDSLTLRSLTGYMDLSRFTRSDTDATQYSLVGGPRTTDDEYYSQELQLLGEMEAFKWVVGGYYGYERGHDLTVSDTISAISSSSPTLYDTGVRNTSTAIFAQGVWEFLPRWSLTVGARYSWDEREMIANNSNARFDCTVPAEGFETTNQPGVVGNGPSDCPRTFTDKYDDPSWLVSLDHQLTDDLLLYVKNARGYRSGGRNLKGANTISSFGAFEPESVTEYEIGFKSYFFDRTLRLNLAAFYDDYEDIQKVATVVTTTGGFTSLTVNAAQATVQGFEADLLWKPTDNLTLNLAAGYVEGEYDEFMDVTGDRSNEPFDVPEWTYNLGFGYVLPTSVGELAFNMDYQWKDDFWIDPQVYQLVDFVQEDYGLLSGRISLDIYSIDATVSLFGSNLTDEEYFISGAGPYGSLGFNFAIVGEPRLVGAEFVKRF